MASVQPDIRLPGSIRGTAPLLKAWAQRVRSRHLFFVDLFGLIGAVIVAFAVWMDRLPAPESLGPYLWIAGIMVCSQIAANISLGLYKNFWRFASIGDVWRILACTLVGTMSAWLIVATILAFQPPVESGMPPAALWLLEGVLALGVMATPRFLIRAASELSHHEGQHPEPERTLLYGAGWAGVMVARSAERSPETGVAPVGFLDDDLDLKGRRVGGMLVHGDVSALGRAKRVTGASTLLITMPSATGEAVRRVVDAAIRQGLHVRTVPAMTDIIDGTVDATRARNVRIEDLLRRPPATQHSPELKAMLAGRPVMITGAAGSIGSELVRQVLALGPSRIVMVDQAESGMYMVARDLETRKQVAQGLTEISTHLVDITDQDAIYRLMAETEPVLVIHAAAYKHVPMLEEHAAQAARVNIGGTKAVVDAAIACGVERFVLVSSDKAVRPSSVMGASKRIAEMIVSEAAQRTGRAYVSVRFGNVLGSYGSVIPVFTSQLENGQPLTVTDPEMTRYFMTIPEASWLILDAAALSESGCLYVLDMGAPVRIMDLATDLIRLSGRDPDSVPITYVGLRPGEKLHEELFYDDEDVTATDVPKVLRSTTTEFMPASIRADVDRFITLGRDGRDDVLRRELMDFVRVPLDGLARIPVEPNGAGAGQAVHGYRPVVPMPVHANGAATKESGPSGVAGGVARAGHDAATDLLGQRTIIRSPAVTRDTDAAPEPLGDRPGPPNRPA